MPKGVFFSFLLFYNTWLYAMVQARATPLAPHDWKTMLAQAHTINAPLNAEAHLAAEVPDRHSHSGAQLRDENGERQSATAGAHPVAAGTQAATAGAPGVIVLDVRNDYEWDAGHFVGAGRPQEVRNICMICLLQGGQNSFCIPSTQAIIVLLLSTIAAEQHYPAYSALHAESRVRAGLHYKSSSVTPILLVLCHRTDLAPGRALSCHLFQALTGVLGCMLVV